jgi:hypothetical protein
MEGISGVVARRTGTGNRWSDGRAALLPVVGSCLAAQGTGRGSHPAARHRPAFPRRVPLQPGLLTRGRGIRSLSAGTWYSSAESKAQLARDRYRIGGPLMSFSQPVLAMTSVTAVTGRYALDGDPHNTGDRTGPPSRALAGGPSQTRSATLCDRFYLLAHCSRFRGLAPCSFR